MKPTLVLAILIPIASVCAGANQTPVAVTGFNQDMVIDAGTLTLAAFQSASTATMDGGTAKTASTWYQVGENTSAPATGLPMGTTFVSASDPTTSFALQSAAGNNAIMLDSSNTTGTFSLTSPTVFSSLSLLGASAVGPTTLGVTLRFTDSTTLSLGSFVVPDWFNGTPVSYTANGRVASNGFDAINSGNPRLYQLDLNLPGAAQIKALADITFSDLSGGLSRAAMFGVSGLAVPTPVPESASTLEFLIAGSAVLLGLRLRRRAPCRKASV